MIPVENEHYSMPNFTLHHDGCPQSASGTGIADISKYESKTEKPQLAHDAYYRMLAISAASRENPRNPFDIWLAAFTGQAISYRSTA